VTRGHRAQYSRSRPHVSEFCGASGGGALDMEREDRLKEAPGVGPNRLNRLFRRLKTDTTE
jgi:hypothetical protein